MSAYSHDGLVLFRMMLGILSSYIPGAMCTRYSMKMTAHTRADAVSAKSQGQDHMHKGTGEHLPYASVSGLPVCAWTMAAGTIIRKRIRQDAKPIEGRRSHS
jgi:hypothetical protein